LTKDEGPPHGRQHRQAAGVGAAVAASLTRSANQRGAVGAIIETDWSLTTDLIKPYRTATRSKIGIRFIEEKGGWCGFFDAPFPIKIAF
jgi:hypothetical protein